MTHMSVVSCVSTAIYRSRVCLRLDMKVRTTRTEHYTYSSLQSLQMLTVGRGSSLLSARNGVSDLQPRHVQQRCGDRQAGCEQQLFDIWPRQRQRCLERGTSVPAAGRCAVLRMGYL